MEQTGLSQSLLDTPVRRLSGGEQRRLALLRSLSISPEFLILDEVTAGLDLISTEAVLQLLEEYEQEHDCAYLVITHDLQIASRLCEVIYEIEHGKITKKAVR
jgi:ABC-type dipeptide/oligopeptide/nickel transport system ATPase subunit